MWLLKFLPDWIFHGVLVVGVMAMAASFVLKFVPFVTAYRLPIQAAGLILTVLGVWFEGAMSNEAAWQTRVHEMEQKVAAAEVKSAQETVRIVTRVVTQIQTIKDTTNANTPLLAPAIFSCVRPYAASPSTPPMAIWNRPAPCKVSGCHWLVT